MTKEEAIRLLDLNKEYLKNTNNIGLKDDIEALDMAIQALENIGHLTDRPCSACEFRKENGCCKWDCVFKGV